MRQKIEKIISLSKRHYALLAVLAAYFFLSFWRFAGQGVVNFDEAYFTIVARTFSDIAKALVFHPGAVLDGGFLSDLAADHGNVYTAARPSFILFSAFLGMFSPAETATRLASLLAGALAIIFFYRLSGLYGLNRFLRAAAALLLALSPLFLLYCRLGLSPIFSSALLLASFFYLLKFRQTDKRNYLLAAGALSSLALMSHYSLLLFIGLFGLGGLFLLYQKKRKIGDYLLFFFSFILLPLSWELLTRIGVWLASRGGFIPRGGREWGIYSYFQEFSNQLAIAKSGSSVFFGQPFYYLELIFSQEGAVFSLVLLAGFIVFLKKIRRFEYGLLFALLAAFLFLISASGLKFPRTMMPVFPFLYLLAATALAAAHQAAERWRPLAGKMFLAIACLAIIIPNLGHLRDILNLETNVKSLSSYIKENYDPKGTLILSAAAPIWRVELEGYEVEDINQPAEWENLVSGRKILTFSDYFTASVYRGKAFPFDEERKKVKEAPTNIFSVKPAIMDLLYESRKEMDKIFSDNQGGKIVLYETSR